MCFLILFICLCSLIIHQASLIWLFWILCQIIYILYIHTYIFYTHTHINAHTSLRLVSEDLFIFLNWSCFPNYFLFFVVLCWYLHICRNSYLSQSLQTDLNKGNIHKSSQLDVLEAYQTFSMDTIFWTFVCRYQIRRIYLFHFFSEAHNFLFPMVSDSFTACGT